LATKALLRWTAEWRTAPLSARLKTHHAHKGAEHEDQCSPGRDACCSRAAGGGVPAGLRGNLTHGVQPPECLQPVRQKPATALSLE